MKPTEGEPRSVFSIMREENTAETERGKPDERQGKRGFDSPVLRKLFFFSLVMSHPESKERSKIKEKKWQRILAM